MFNNTKNYLDNRILLFLFVFTVSVCVLAGASTLIPSTKDVENDIMNPKTQILVTRTFLMRLLLWAVEYILYFFPVFSTTRDNTKKPFMLVEYAEASSQFYYVSTAFLLIRMLFVAVFGIPFFNHFFDHNLNVVWMLDAKHMAMLWIQFVMWVFLAMDCVMIVSFFAGFLVLSLAHATKMHV